MTLYILITVSIGLLHDVCFELVSEIEFEVVHRFLSCHVRNDTTILSECRKRTVPRATIVFVVVVYAETTWGAHFGYDSQLTDLWHTDTTLSMRM